MQALAASCEELRARTGNPPLVEQNSIGHTQIIISQDFKWIPEGVQESNVRFWCIYIHVHTIKRNSELLENQEICITILTQH
jgi:hypothetical protein